MSQTTMDLKPTREEQNSTETNLPTLTSQIEATQELPGHNSGAEFSLLSVTGSNDSFPHSPKIQSALESALQTRRPKSSHSQEWFEVYVCYSWVYSPSTPK
ncbi:hypothetical protein RF11_10679 [Thelohanellus kitauei]|uniref:Uncharacterized protein n=1 Tax=Thelohanellus kitauei TaxID=669202 RepID=A0A0C2MYV1_THEKT|nr:hypothetical protein RF11_10679 [Thelohanellus kitauei]